MYLHLVLPDHAQTDELINARQDGSVTLYLATDPASDSRAELIELGNLWSQARAQLEEAGADFRKLEPYDALMEDLREDEGFWAYQANSLAIFLTPDSITTYQLPTTLESSVHVSDRFQVMPLLRSLSFPTSAYVLALSQNATRVLEVLPAGDPEVLNVPDLPANAIDAVGVPSISGRKHHNRVQGDEGKKMRLGQYCRAVDQALRPMLVGRNVPLILAAARPLDDIYRQWNTYPNLASKVISGNPDTATDGELAAAARAIIDEIHQEQVAAVATLFEERSGSGRAVTDVADVAKAATFGMVDTVVVAFDTEVPGAIDDAGAVSFDSAEDAVNYGVIDEIARRVWQSGGRVIAVRKAEVPGGGEVAAILRWSPS